MNQPVKKAFYRGADGNLYDERGLLLPFLAGVLVTTPFVFLAKNQNQNNSQPMYYPPQQAPVYYPMYNQPYQPYPPYPYPYR